MTDRWGGGYPSPLMERVDSCHSIWIFDTERMRFRRLPRGTNVDGITLESDWEPYYGLEVSPDSGAFAVALDEARTRFLRSWRHTEPCSHCSAPGDVTGELTVFSDEPGRS
jgi:hypothetical protein